jgi:3-phosphoshikimate 1-carboxyvinyltransferase
MRLVVSPGNSLVGTVQVPGDKSLSHRAVLFAAMAEGESRIANFLISGVTRVMLEALTALGVKWELKGDVLTVWGRGLGGWQAPERSLNCGNSATTIRLLAGALAAAGIPAVLDGSAGLRRRPMGRIVEPLQQMGVPVTASEGGAAPLALSGRQAGQALHGLNADLPVASAQVKTCLLLAALAAEGETVLREPGPSRDHTERMLGSMGVEVTSRVFEVDGTSRYETRLVPPKGALTPLDIRLPGDISAAAFLLAAGSIVAGSEIGIPGVGLNPTRTGLIDALRSMGGDITVANEGQQAGEPVGDLRVRAARLSGTQVSGPLVVRMIDEFSVFGAAAAHAEGTTVVRDAEELRYKESDRITTLCQELAKLGVETSETQDGFSIRGGRPKAGEVVHSHGDHRLAMSLAVTGLAAQGSVTIEGAEMINESFPGFVDALRGLGAEIVVLTEGAA